jgi:hypothetical protein
MGNSLPYKAIFFLLILFAVACDKELREEKKLTDETQEGAQTFSCLVNGKAFNTCPRSMFGNDPVGGGITTSFYTDRISAGAVGNCDKTDESVYVYIDSFYGVGEYPLIYPNMGVCNTNYFDQYTTRYTNNGKVNITYYNRWQGILAGTFEFVASKESDPNDKVTVTKGRFDIKF